jgi:hypothetical protein
MKARRLLIPTTKVFGFVAIGLGCAFGSLLALPTKSAGSAGLYRDNSLGQSVLVYGNTSGRGADFYFTSLSTVIGAAVIWSAVGCSLLWLGHRLSRSLA